MNKRNIDVNLILTRQLLHEMAPKERNIFQVYKIMRNTSTEKELCVSELLKKSALVWFKFDSMKVK